PVYQLMNKADLKACVNKGGTAITAANFYTYNTSCKKINLEAGFFAAIWNHEGYGKSNNSGHQGQLEFAAHQPQNELYTLLEHVFAEGQDDTRAAVVAIAD